RAGSHSDAHVELPSRPGSLARVSLEARGDGTARVASPRILGRVEAAPAREADPPATRPSILLYLVDTLRADHVGSYGYALPTTPEIDAFAGEGLRFAHVLAQSA